ncbi:hypothetical protein [Prosthecobacter fluviatilis]|uniref:Uncharacterized protein n=1 Tax=Prosthecobacter fluviatilis TaxID=445931 RepID=A0ABW0KVY6_9BACT
MPAHGIFCLLLAMHAAAPLRAQEPAVFTPPQAYPASRYEAGWSKNPFTLKTAASLLAQDSFARDLAIGAHYGAAESPTVVIVNVRTGERTPLRKDHPSPSGLRLISVHLTSRRAECRVEISQGSQVASLTYDAAYLSQLAAAETSRMATSKPAPAAKGGQLPPLPSAKRTPPASPTVKVSTVEPPLPLHIPVQAPAPAQGRPVLPVFPSPAPAAR